MPVPAPKPVAQSTVTDLATESRLPPSQIMGAAKQAGGAQSLEQAAKAISDVPPKQREAIIRELAMARGAEFAKAAAKKAGVSTKMLGL
jgi:hypothetical protein